MLVNEMKWDFAISEDKPEVPVVEILASENTKRAFAGGMRMVPYHPGEDNGDLYAMVASYYEDHVEVLVTDRDCLETCVEALKAGADYRQALAENNVHVLEDAGFSFEDETDYHFRDSKFDKLQDLAVMGLQMMLYLGSEAAASYTAVRFQMQHSGANLDEIDVRKTRLDGDHRPFDFGEDYWADQLESPVGYFFGIVYSYDRSEEDHISNSGLYDDFTSALAATDLAWETMSDERKEALKVFRLCLLEVEYETGMFHLGIKQTLKDYKSEAEKEA